MGVRDELRAKREGHRSRDWHFDYGVPGYEPEEGEPSDLVIRFNLAPYEVVAKYHLTFNPADLFELDKEAIVQSCREILVREDGKLASFVEGEQTTFATIDDAMGFKAETAKEAVEELFPTPLSVGECAGALIGWSRNVHRQAEDEAAGESEAGRISSEPAKQPASV